MNLDNNTESNKLENNELSKMKLAVLISGSGTNLQALIDAQKSNYFQSEIALVISSSAAAVSSSEAAASFELKFNLSTFARSKLELCSNVKPFDLF